MENEEKEMKKTTVYLPIKIIDFIDKSYNIGTFKEKLIVILQDYIEFIDGFNEHKILEKFIKLFKIMQFEMEWKNGSEKRYSFFLLEVLKLFQSLNVDLLQFGLTKSEIRRIKDMAIKKKSSKDLLGNIFEK